MCAHTCFLRDRSCILRARSCILCHRSCMAADSRFIGASSRLISVHARLNSPSYNVGFHSNRTRFRRLFGGGFWICRLWRILRGVAACGCEIPAYAGMVHGGTGICGWIWVWCWRQFGRVAALRQGDSCFTQEWSTGGWGFVGGFGFGVGGNWHAACGGF